MELMELDGVSSVIANQETKTVEVEFDSPASDQSIRATLMEINYPAIP
jgi:copper chaperone CopZ